MNQPDHNIVLEEDFNSPKKSPFVILFVSLSSLLTVGLIIGLFIASSENSYVETECSNLILDNMITTGKLISI